MEKFSQSEIRHQMIMCLIDGLGLKAAPLVKRLEVPVRTPVLIGAAESVLSEVRELKSTEATCKRLSGLISELTAFGEEFKGF